MAFQTPEDKVFGYTRRRYDGGPEIEAIQMIEWQLQMMEQQQHMAQVSAQMVPGQMAPVAVMAGGMPHPEMGGAPVAPMPFVAMGPAPTMPMADPMMAQAPVELPPATLSGKCSKAFVLPVLELILGVIGIVTCHLMRMKSIKGAHPNVAAAEAERNALLTHSQSVVANSVRDMKLAPLRFLHMCLQ